MTRTRSYSMRPTRKRIVAAGLVTTAALLILVFLEAGNWLVVSDPLQRAPALVVFGGEVPFRAMEAATVYNQGWAREVWLTQGRPDEQDDALARLSVETTPEHVYNRLVLERLGVPGSAIRVLPERVRNTAEEVRAIAAELKVRKFDRVILVTSKYHTRRVRAIWQALVGSHPEGIVRSTTEDPFSPERWWRNTADAMSVLREWFGILNVRLGFPIKTERW